MPSTYKTPGVYIEEISTLPASIAQVETAIPAFIGFTLKATKNGQPLDFKPTRIDSLLEYESYFGTGPTDLEIDVDLNSDNSVSSVTFGSTFCLYDSMRLFFSNGGGPCYIVSCGGYDSDSSDYFENLKKGLDTLRKEDEPTLILFPDAVFLSTATSALLGTLQKDALKQCNDLQDRFCIFDLLNGDDDLDVETSGETPDLAFRNNIGVQYLKYGAAYYPNVRTTLGFDFGYENIKSGLTKNGISVSLSAISPDSTFVDHYNNILADEAEVEDFYTDPASNPAFPPSLLADPVQNLGIADGFDTIVELTNTKDKKAELIQKAKYIQFMIQGFVTLNGDLTDNADEDTDTATNNDLLSIHTKAIDVAGKPNYTVLEGYVRRLYDLDISYTTDGGVGYSPLAVVTAAGNNVTYDGVDFSVEDIVANTDIYGAAGTVTVVVGRVRAAFQELYEEVRSYIDSFVAAIDLRKENIEKLLQENNPIYANLVSAVKKEGIVLPPSAAIAGVYAATDNERGVWVAPANRSLNSVVGPKVNVTAEDQANLNVDVTAGKSINAIRSFTGKGTLVWGARTLAGNSNEWRYIPVRRLFNMVEESVKKATEFVVFEPNDKNTWVRTKAMIENFLNQIWRAGGLAGAKAEHAYIVKVGLGETMTSLDILEGRMIIEIHMAAVRPAEFIILRFMHKLQES